MHKTLKRDVGLVGTFSMAVGSMVSSGLFVLPGIAFAATGPAVILSYALASLLVIPAILSQAELTTAMPKAGGSYFFIGRSLGSLAGTFAGFANWFSIALKSAFALLGIGVFATLFCPGITPLHVKLIAIGFCVLFTLLNLFSMGGVHRAQVALVFALLTLLLVYVAGGIGQVDTTKFDTFIPRGTEPILATAALVFVSFGGIKKISLVAEEIRDPARNIPLGMFLAYFVVSVLYILVLWVTVGLVEPAKLSGSLTPISLGAGVVMGRVGSIALAVGAILAFMTTANGGIAGASRTPLAMSRDSLLPNIFLKTLRRSGIPYISILFTSGFMILVMAFLSIENLVKTASTMILVVFALVNVAVIVMRESKVQSYRPTFRSPGYPWVQGAATVIYLFLIYEMGLAPVIATAVFAALGLIWYAIYCRANEKRRSALVHLVERIASKTLVDDSLESELKKIVQERDEMVEDRFDKLIKQCEVFDIDEKISSHKMLSMVAGALAPRFELPENDLLKMFLKREHESSTVVGHGIAIPHVVIDGDHLFDVVLVRCKSGISFSMGQSHVHTAFVMVGSRDERNYHLRALMAIAQITQEPGFLKRWLEASSIDQLRNLVLLSERKRDHRDG
ncbi:amino acid permease [bacterium]|nr:amino acid permease [bacterium]